MFRALNRAKGILVFFGLLTGALSGIFYGLVYDLPEINHLKQFKPSSVTTVYSSDQKILTRFFLEKRFPVRIDIIPGVLVQALVVTEDKDFYRHSGLNLKAIARALIEDIKAGRYKQGASTLTQQLAKTLFLSSEKSVVRKLKEAILAIQIERRYTKNEILELYLNQIYLGSGAYGVEAAARTYFNTSVSDLNLSQAALIAGLPQSPYRYSPLNNPDRALQRRHIVLSLMLANHLISPKQFSTADTEPLADSARHPSANPAPDFTAFLQKELQQLAGVEQPNLLSVKSTLDLSLQKTAKTCIASNLGPINRVASSTTGVLLAIDVHTGAIRAMVGSPFLQHINTSVADMHRPGSIYAPFLYAAAIQAGWEQNRTLMAPPLDFPAKPVFHREVTLRKALSLSLEPPAVRLGNIFSNGAIDVQEKAGIEQDGNMLNLISAYAVFPNQGIRNHPYSIEQIVDINGQIVFKRQSEKQMVLDQITASICTDMLKAVIQEGAGRLVNHSIQKDIAGKEGTNPLSQDGLFIGFSPDLVCGVWVGSPGKPPPAPGKNFTKTALSIWTDVMAAYLKDRPVQYFDIPDGTKVIDIFPDSGRPAARQPPFAAKVLVRK